MWLGMSSCFEELPSRFQHILIEQKTRLHKGNLSDVNKGNTEVIIKKVHHSVERQ
jgi:hypothetical protein